MAAAINPCGDTTTKKLAIDPHVSQTGKTTRPFFQETSMRRTAWLVLAILVHIGPTHHSPAAEANLLAGVATVDITPEPGLMLWGYSDRTHGATGTLDR